MTMVGEISMRDVVVATPGTTVADAAGLADQLAALKKIVGREQAREERERR